MRRNHRIVSVLAGLVLAAAAATPAAAGTSFDFLFNVGAVGSDDQYFLNLSVGHYGYSRADLDPVLPRLRSVDADLPVVMFLARESGESLSVIAGMRARGLSWSVIFGNVRVPMSVLFVGIDRDPGPPYGRAWGHWKKNPRVVRLADTDIVGLVQVQVGSRWARMTPYEVAKARGRGRKVAVLVAEKKGRPYKSGKSHQVGKSAQSGKPAKAGNPTKGKGQAAQKPSKGQGHGGSH